MESAQPHGPLAVRTLHPLQAREINKREEHELKLAKLNGKTPFKSKKNIKQFIFQSSFPFHVLNGVGLLPQWRAVADQSVGCGQEKAKLN